MTAETDDALKEKAQEVVLGLEKSVVALSQGAERLSAASEKFAEKSPGKRSSWLGYLLLIIAILAEVTEGFTFGGFKFSDTMSTNMMYIGGFLVAIGAALDVYFSLKTIEVETVRASKLEEQAAEARKTVSSIWSWLAGR
jgi:hypothetical protein